jgi:MFS family permease
MRLPRAPLINRDYARLWYGQAISSLGDYAFNTTLILWMATDLGAAKPWAPEAVSGVMLAAGAAILLIGPLAGVFVDRWNRRSTMLGTEVVRGALVSLLTALFFVPVHALPVWAWLTAVYLAVFALNAAGQFFGPARFATIGSVVPGKEDRARAAGIGQATSATVSMLGPPLAAPLLFTAGPQWALLFDAATYAVSYFAIRSIRADPESRGGQQASAHSRLGRRPGLWGEFTDGLRLFVGRRLLVAVLLVALVSQLSIGALNALNVFFVTRNLHVPGSMYGYLATAVGIGTIVGALCGGRVMRHLGMRVTVSAGALLGGMFIILYSRQSVFVVGLALFFLLAVPFGVMNTALTPLLLGAVPKEYIGRMMAVFNPVQQLGSMLSVAAAGWIAGSVLRNFSGTFAGLRFGSIDVIFAGSGVLMIAAGGCAAFAFRPGVMQPEDSPEPPAPAAPDAPTATTSRSGALHDANLQLSPRNGKESHYCSLPALDSHTNIGCYYRRPAGTRQYDLRVTPEPLTLQTYRCTRKRRLRTEVTGGRC